MLDKNGHEVLVVPVEAIEEGSIEALERQHSAVATLAKKVRPSVCTLLVALHLDTDTSSLSLSLRASCYLFTAAADRLYLPEPITVSPAPACSG